MNEVARGVQYINREQSLSQYLAFPSACLSISALAPPPTKHHQYGLHWKMGNRDPGGIRCVLQAAWWDRLNLTCFSATTTHALTLTLLCPLSFSGYIRATITTHSSSFPTIGIPDDIIEKGRDYKLITEVTQDGDTFSWTQIYPTNAKVTNTFTVGKECDMETIGGKKFKVGSKESRDKSMRGIINPAEREGRMKVFWLITTCVFSGHCAHGGRQAEHNLPQLRPHLWDQWRQAHRGKHSHLGF